MTLSIGQDLAQQDTLLLVLWGLSMLSIQYYLRLCAIHSNVMWCYTQTPEIPLISMASLFIHSKSFHHPRQTKPTSQRNFGQPQTAYAAAVTSSTMNTCSYQIPCIGEQHKSGSAYCWRMGEDKLLCELFLILWVLRACVCVRVELMPTFGKPNTGDLMENPNQFRLRDVCIIDFIPNYPIFI